MLPCVLEIGKGHGSSEVEAMLAKWEALVSIPGKGSGVEGVIEDHEEMTI